MEKELKNNATLILIIEIYFFKTHKIHTKLIEV